MASTLVLPFSKGDQRLPAPAAAPAPRRLTPKTIFVVVGLWLVSFTLLQRPIYHCYHHMSQHLGRKPLDADERARIILKTTPLIDGHVDFPIAVRAIYGNHIYNSNFTEAFENGELFGHVDLARLREGLSGGAFWSVFAPCPEDGDDFSDENYAPSVQYTLDQIDLMTRIQAAYPKDFSTKLDSSMAWTAFWQSKFISPLGVEGLHQIGNKASNLRRFHDLGVRYATLTHNCHNKFADAALTGNPPKKSEPKWGGVSKLGRKLVHEMNRIGMIVDLSHVSDDTMKDVLGGGEDWSGSIAPIIYSHSSAYAICPHPRNVNDDILKMVKERNSLVMVNIAPDFIACVDNGNENGVPDPDEENATLQQVAKHIMHIGALVGYDHVGIGTDFDGIPKPPQGLEDVSKYPDLIAELLRNGVSDRDAAKVAGLNVLRVWKDVDAVAAKMQAEGAPVWEDDVPSVF